MVKREMMQRSKEIKPKKRLGRLNIKSDNFTGRNREKSNIAIEKFENLWLDNTIMISDFWGTNNIFVEFMSDET